MDVPDKISSSSSLSNEPTSSSKGAISKHFMSPNISAISKAIPTRKKILGERNQSLDTLLPKPSNLQLKLTEKASNLDLRTNFSTDDVGYNQENYVLDDYHSPRPQFLRYKPIRRREMFLETENEVKETKMEEMVDDSDDEEFDGVDEKIGCWGLRGVLKVVFLMSVLVFSSLYISCMNTPTPSPAVVSFKNGCRVIEDHVYGLVKSLESGNLFLVGTEGSELGFSVVDVNVHELDYDKDELDVEVLSGKIEDFGLFSEGGEDEIVDESLDMVIEVESAEVGDGSSDLEIAVVDGFLEAEVSETPLEIVSSVVDDIEKNKEVAHVPTKSEFFEAEAKRITEDMENWIIIVCSVILFLTLGVHFVKIIKEMKASKAAKKRSKLLAYEVDEHIEQSVSLTNSMSLLADEVDEHIEQPVSLSHSMSLIDDEYSDQTDESRAPTAELLGDIVVGEMSSSRNSCGMRGRVIENEMSSNSVSSMSSHSHFAERSLKKEEEGGDEEEVEKKVLTTTTPLRRSSRIRNRVMSP
ncbi:uncharacterized protein LOC126683328 isoform X2 [Mercurialis annua]|uniref:uncharacterized protein LOC126683328 isoform X2 n=1 Tax=Mercurialis annua TaxID=3986 RepID=UPI0021606936|nr:uncharacterized protein LOC126683328 isoform X2 [Mercurialis annua]